VITPVHLAAVDPAAVTAAAAKPSAGPDFAATLGDAVEAAGRAEREAEAQATRFANGDPDIAIDQVMIASEKAAISLRYAVTLKNHALEAYRELMATPV
jgi:flagellar hook-basal body complex protein FliE